MSQTPSSGENSTEELPKIDVPKLAGLVKESKSYAFLIGAGTSRPTPSEIKTAGELIEDWKRECYERYHTGENDPDEETVREWAREQEEADDVADGDEYGYWFEELLPRAEARRERIQELVEDADPTTGHLVLASMMSNRRGDQYVPLTVTPNFDDLLLDAFYLLSAERPQIVNHNALVPELQITRDDPAIVKLHGDYLYEALNTESETDSLDAPMSEALERTVDEYGLIVVGYSGRDDSIMSVLEDADFPDHGLYWCVREPQEDDEADTVEEKISDRAAELVRETGGEIVPIEGFNSLMSQFNRQIDGLPPLTDRDELQRRFDKRLDRIDTIFDERQDAEPGEAEEELLDASELSNRAYEALEAGENEQAKKLYDRLIESEGPSVERLGNRGVAKFHLSEYEAAIKDHNKAIELDPEYAKAYNNRGYAKDELGEYEAAIEDYDRAIELDPEYATAYNNRANANRSLGEYEVAIEDYDEAIEINSNNSVMLQKRSETYIESYDPPRAKNDAEKARQNATSTDEDAISLLLYLISTILLEEDTQPEEREYRDLCKQKFTTSWKFTQLDEWLEDTDLEPEKEDKISELMDLLREHKPENQ